MSLTTFGLIPDLDEALRAYSSSDSTPGDMVSC
jgi:hypothetical protein